MKVSHNVIYRHDPHIPSLESYRVRDSTHAFPDHFHESIYAVGLMEGGGSFCLGPDKPDSFIAPGELALISPGLVHSGVPRPGIPADYRMVYIGIPQLRAMGCELTGRDISQPDFDCLIIRDARAWFLMQRLSRMVLDPKSCPLERESLALVAFSHLLSSHASLKAESPRTGQENRMVRQACELLGEDLSLKVTLDQTARAVGLSRYHFLRIFKAQTGLSPHQFRMQRRIDAARILLKQGRPISQVALDTGFADQAHFTHAFRKFVGATPKCFRNS